MRSIVSACVLSMALTLAAPAVAQTMGEDWDYFGIPMLTCEQRTALDKVRLDFLRFAMPRNAEIERLVADAGALLATDKPDAAALKAMVDRANAVRGEIETRNAELVLQVKLGLRSEQLPAIDYLLVTQPSRVLRSLFGRGGGNGPSGAQQPAQGGPGNAGGPGNPGPAMGGPGPQGPDQQPMPGTTTCSGNPGKDGAKKGDPKPKK